MLYLPEKDELIPITNDKTTFYDCGFNEPFDNLSFQKKLEIVNNLVRQSIVPDCRPRLNDNETLIGNCHTAVRVSEEYLKHLKIGINLLYLQYTFLVGHL